MSNSSRDTRDRLDRAGATRLVKLGRAIFPAILLTTLIAAGCSDDAVTTPQESRVRTNFHLWSGLQGRMVRITIDSTVVFHAVLSPGEPLAGPVATFTTDLPRDDHRLIVYRDSCLCLAIPPKRDTLTFSLGQSTEYWLGIGVVSDTVYIHLQDSAFWYLGNQH